MGLPLGRLEASELALALQLAEALLELGQDLEQELAADLAYPAVERHLGLVHSVDYYLGS